MNGRGHAQPPTPADREGVERAGNYFEALKIP